jgi:hypothetical protein
VRNEWGARRYRRPSGAPRPTFYSTIGWEIRAFATTLTGREFQAAFLAAFHNSWSAGSLEIAILATACETVSVGNRSAACL